MSERYIFNLVVDGVIQSSPIEGIMVSKNSIYSTTHIARLCHEANRIICHMAGDFSQPMWDEAPDWQRNSAIDGVRFHLSEPDASPSASHENWVRTKLRDGWTFGPVKDADLKTHPCITPFENLPPHQQAKDYAFRSIVHALAPFWTGATE